MQLKLIARGISLALVCLALLGALPIIANLRPADIEALPFAFALSVWQALFAFPLFALELRGKNKGIFGTATSARERRRMIAVGIVTGVLFGMSTWLYVLGVEKAGATNAAIAIQAYPLFAILWESLFLKRHKTPFELGLTLLMLAALYYLGTAGTFKLSGLSPWFLLSLGVPLLWSIAHVVIKEELGRTAITPTQVTFFRVVISALFLFGVLAVTAPAGLASLGTVAVLRTASAVMGFVYVVELIVWFYAVRHIDVSLASSITAPWPALTMVLAVFFLGDTIAPYQIGALVVVVACIYGLTLLSLRKGKPGDTPAVAKPR